MHNPLIWITPATMHHQFRDKTYLQRQLNITKLITLFSLITHHSCRCFQNHIYMLLTNFTNVFLILQQLRNFQKISLPLPWKLQNTGQWHVNMAFERCYCLPSVLGRRSRPDHTRHSFRMCLHHLLLDTHKPHSMTAT